MSDSVKTPGGIEVASGIVGKCDGRTMSRKRLVRGALVGLAVSATVLAANAGSAIAGTAGQGIAIEPNCNANWAYIQGRNQHNHATKQWVLVPAVDPGDLWGGCYGLDVYDWGYWWEGSVRIEGYTQYNSGHAGYTGTSWINVPVNQGSWDDWVYTQVPGITKAW